MEKQLELNFKTVLEPDYSKDAELTIAAKAILKDRYFLKKETSPQDVFLRAAKAYSNEEDHAERLYTYMKKGWFMPATPILANAASSRGLPISCFLNKVGDSREDIATHLSENLWLSTSGGGIGTDWSYVRSVGTSTSTGNVTTGIIPFIKTVDSLTVASSQGSTRRGATAVSLRVDHPEIEEFIELRKVTGDHNRRSLNLHNAVAITDKFMEHVESGNSFDLIDPHTLKTVKSIDPRALWMKILKTRMETGEPYLFFIDAANRGLPDHLKAKGLKINTTNLCVAPETKILTDKGYVEIASVENLNVNVWNGKEWSNVKVVKTGKDVELIKVTFSDNSFIQCTPEHFFYIQEGFSKGKVNKVHAKNLKSGDRLEKWELPSSPVQGHKKMSVDPYTQGFFAGDGIFGSTFSWVYEPKYKCLERLKGIKGNEHNCVERITLKHGAMLDKFFVPSGQYTLEDKLNWLAGFLDGDGCVIESTHSQNIQACSVEYDFIKNVKHFLQEIGVSSSVNLKREEGFYELPNHDGNNGTQEYFCNTVWLLNINSFGVKKLIELGFKCERLKFKDQNPQRDSSRFITVNSIEWTKRISDTFCFTESIRNRGMFNGVVTGQCTEIMLPTDTDRTAVCCLSSVNLEYYDEWKDDPMFIYDVLSFLDNALEFFIWNARHMDNATKSAYRERSVGLGVMGFHTLLQSKNIPFESPMADGLNRKIFKSLKEECHKVNLQLGEERGEAPEAKGTGQRFSHVQSCAPTANISVFVPGGTSPSVEPWTANAFTHKTSSGVHLTQNKVLDKVLKEEYFKDGKELKDIWTSIILHEGSVQHLEWLTSLHREVFKTAFELNQEWIIEHASNRQEFIDQGQSINLFLPFGISESNLHKLHKSAWTKGLKSLYYLRTKSVGKAETISYGKGECLSCT